MCKILFATPASMLGAGFLLVGTACAQRQFDPLWNMPVDLAWTSAVTSVDVDGDGDTDLVVGTNNLARNRLYLNDGSGWFLDAPVARFPREFANTGGIAAGDLDGDGDADLVVANSSQEQNRIYSNDGTGAFIDVTAIRFPSDPGTSASVVLADVEGDGDLDIVFGNRGRADGLYLNDGTGTFVDVSAMRMPPNPDETTAIAAGDVDADGDLDLVLGNSEWNGSPNRLYLNDGSGTFTDVTAARMPAEQEKTRAVALGDFDRDGDLDVVLGNGYFATEQNRLYLNDGTGTFSDATPTAMPTMADPTGGLAVGDVDRDGDLDLMVANARSPMGNRLLLNDGAGVFADAAAGYLPTRLEESGAVCLDDLDGDGYLDVVFGNRVQDRLFRNDGTGRFMDEMTSGLPPDEDATRAVGHGDVDGDGDLDLVLGNAAEGFFPTRQNRLYLNDGAGSFADATASHLPIDTDDTYGLALADVDGDRDLDIVWANRSTANRLHLNDGAGGFTDATAGRMPADLDDTRAVVLGDVDGDGDIDAVLANYGARNRLYLNDGLGTFTDATASRLPSDSDATSDVVLGDVDGDGALDLVFANVGVQNRLYRNDGTGTFVDVTAMRLPADSDGTAAIVLGDVDGDGSPDLVLGNVWTSTGSARTRLFLNDGMGVFRRATEGRMPNHVEATQDIAMGDVDEDGDVDVVLGNLVSMFEIDEGHSRLYLNDGSGWFTDATAARMPWAPSPVGAVALFDADGDRDLDLVLAGRSDSLAYLYGIPNHLYLNLHRQVHTPWPPALGGSFVVALFSQPLYGQSLHLALPGLGFALAPGPVATPYGNLFLDPARIAPLPFASVPPPAGRGTVCIPVPQDPALPGSIVHVQALVLDLFDPSRAALTNYTVDAVVR